ncbi:MAG: LysR family transcriptional regulator [Caulobacteraceae bacterium]
MSNYLKRIDLNALLLFYEVVNAESIRQASARLHVPKATISRKLRQLEQTVGAVLLKRGPQKLSMTDTGATLYEHCERIVAEVSEASFALSDMQSQLRGVLRLSVPFGFGSEWISAAVGRFALQYPHLDLYIRAAPGWVDVSQEQVDVAINIGKIRNETLPAAKLGELTRGVYASPAYCARAGVPERPADLLRFEAIQLDSQLEDGLWTFTEPGRAPTVSPSRVRVSDVGSARSMALAGLGLAILPNLMVIGEVREGALVRLLPDWALPPLPVSAVFLERRYLPLRIRTFVDFLISQLESQTAQV